MFSPEPAAEPASLRINPRRRRRNDADTVPRPARKRSRIASDNYLPSTNGHVPSSRSNGHNPLESNGVNGGINGHGNGTTKELALRDKRVLSGALTRQLKDTSTVLTRNSKFAVHSLPALPDKLRKNQNASLRLFFRSRQSSNLAIAVTHESVLIWDCTLPSSSPTPRLLSLPYPAKSSDHLPLACLVSNASKDLGLVLVYPCSGTITFWEDIDSAESLKLFEQRRHGVEGTLKLLSGERIQEIIDVESAGLVLLTSSGRLAHLTLQDSLGHAQVAIDFLSNTTKGSFFGDLVQVFQSSWRNRLISVKTRVLTKNRVEVVALSNEGIFKIWEVREAGQSAFIGEIESAIELREELAKITSLDFSAKTSLKYLDFAIFNGLGNQLARNGDASSTPIRALLLVQVLNSPKSKFIILDITLANSKTSILRIFPISVYEPSTVSDVPTQLILPTVDHTVFVLHNNSLILVSLPTSRSQRSEDDDGSNIPSFYQDVVKFNAERGGHVITASAEAFSRASKQSKHLEANVLLFTQSAGALRVSASDYNARAAETRFRLPSAQSKLEQAVFFGSLAKGVLDLYDLSNFNYSSAEIESAALIVSTKILTTSSEYLHQTAASMDQHLLLRMKAMQDLADYLIKHCPPLSRSAKWKLLSHAERLAAARAMWKSHNLMIADKDRKSISLLEEGIDSALERYKEDENSQFDKEDDVRLWFTKNLDSLERLFPLCFSLINERSKNGSLHKDDFLRLLPEMNNLIVKCLGTAYQFRQRNAILYGLGEEDTEDGLLTVGYEDLPKFWTSSDELIKSVSWHVKFTHSIITTFLKAESTEANEPFIDSARDLAAEMDAVIRLSCKSHIEGYRWLMAQSDEVNQQKGIAMKNTFESTIRPHQVQYLYEMGQSEQGLLLAEDLEDIPALVDLSLLELDAQKSSIRRSVKSKGVRSQVNGGNTDAIEQQIKHYFRKFGQRFAQPFYDGQVSTTRLADLIDKDLGTNETRTEFLRSDSTYAKVAWINEVLNEDNMLLASKSLMAQSHSRENNNWARRIELSLAKLALLAAPEAQQESSPENDTAAESAYPVESLISQNERDLAILEAEQRLYATVRPVGLDALDASTRLSDIMDHFASRCSQTHPSLAQIVRLGLSELISHRRMGAESLIDVLTLATMPLEKNAENNNIVQGEQFYLALKVLDAATEDFDAETVGMLHRLIWKRCIVAQDWNQYALTDGVADSDLLAGLAETSAFQTIKFGIKEGFFTPPLDGSIPQPSSLVGAGSSPDDLASRFPRDDIRPPMAEDNAKDDDTLKEFLEQAKLDDIWSEVKNLAIQHAAQEAEENAEKEFRYAEFVASTEEDLDNVEGVLHEEDYIKEEDETDDDNAIHGLQNAEEEAAHEDPNDTGDVEMAD